MSKPSLERLKTYFRHLGTKDASELISLGADIMKSVQAYAEKPTPVNAVKEIFNIWKVLDSSKMYADDYFCPNWDSPFASQFNNFIVESLQNTPTKTIRAAEDDWVIKIAKIYGEEVGWTFCTSDSQVGSLYVPKARAEQAKAALKRLLWEKVAFQTIVMERLKNTTNKHDESLTFSKDEELPALNSEIAEKYSLYLSRTIEANVPRTILFYGPPGTGKSTIARAIASNLGLKTLRIRVEDVADFDNTVIFEAINIFEPDAIILDDLDRAMSQAHLLETMERFHKHTKVVFATVNHRDALDEALMRPGRFDEICKVKRLDDVVVRLMLGPDNEDVFDDVKDWPIAFIREYTIRRRFMSKEEALVSMKELQKRVDRLASSDDDYEDEEEDESDSDENDDEVVEEGLKALGEIENASGEDEDKLLESLEESPSVPVHIKQFLKRAKAQSRRFNLARKR